jgi:hypothetical protein
MRVVSDGRTAPIAALCTKSDALQALTEREKDAAIRLLFRIRNAPAGVRDLCEQAIGADLEFALRFRGRFWRKAVSVQTPAMTPQARPLARCCDE